MTRSQNSFLNIVTSLFSSLLLPVLNLIVRRVFLNTLGTSYLGIEGVFSNILTALSIADLGLSSAIGYMLYKPLEEDDKPRIQALMYLYRRIYRVIGLIILIAGVCLIPLLPTLVKDYSRMAQLGLNAVLIYMLYLLNTVSSYWFFAYKDTLVSAAQKNYLLTTVGYVFNIIQAVTKVILLYTTHSFMIYLVTTILFSVVMSITRAVICDRRFPFARQKPPTLITGEERRDIFKKCYTLFFHRFNGTALNTSDTLILSAFSGLDAVGLYANYIALKLSIANILASVLYATAASIGSLFSAGHPDWTRLVYRATHMLTFFLFGIGAIGTAILTNDCLAFMFGPQFVVTSWTYNGTTFPIPLALLIGIELYFSGHAVHVYLFRNGSGLFQDLRYRPIASILLNLVVSLVTVPYLGMAGCVIGTICTYVFTETLIDPIFICHRALHIRALPYFRDQAIYAAVTAAAGLLTWWICGFIVIPSPLLSLFVRGCVCVAVPGAIFAALFFRTEEFGYLLNTLRDVLHLPGARGGSAA